MSNAHKHWTLQTFPTLQTNQYFVEKLYTCSLFQFIKFYLGMKWIKVHSWFTGWWWCYERNEAWLELTSNRMKTIVLVLALLLIDEGWLWWNCWKVFARGACTYWWCQKVNDTLFSFSTVPFPSMLIFPLSSFLSRCELFHHYNWHHHHRHITAAATSFTPNHIVVMWKGNLKVKVEWTEQGLWRLKT